jgi:hypothetical protein
MRHHHSQESYIFLETSGVSHSGLAIYTKNLKEKGELWKTQLFHHAKI